MASKRICSIEGCGKPYVARGWCALHYQRWQTHGDPSISKAKHWPRGEPERFLREVVLAYDGDACLEWPFSKNKDGYATLFGGDTQLVSRRVCEVTHGPAPTPKHEAAHSCGKGHEACVAKRHLSWKTHAENAADMLMHGTSARGERSGLAKLTETQVRQIRSMLPDRTHAELGEKFGVHRNTISNIASDNSWWWL